MTAETNAPDLALDERVRAVANVCLPFAGDLFANLDESSQRKVAALVKDADWLVGLEILKTPTGMAQVSLVIVSPQGERRPLATVAMTAAPGASPTTQ